MTSHNFITTEKLRSWHNVLLRYTLVAEGAYKFKQTNFSTVQNQSHKPMRLHEPMQRMTNFKSQGTNINHPVVWYHSKIVAHASSSKLATNPMHYGSYGLIFASCGGLMPKVLKAKQSVASFKLVKGSVIGLQIYIRGRQMDQFRYKWSFLAASANGAANVNSDNNGYGLTNVFIFPELDLLDYYAFEPLSGFDLIFG